MQVLHTNPTQITFCSLISFVCYPVLFFLKHNVLFSGFEIRWDWCPAPCWGGPLPEALCAWIVCYINVICQHYLEVFFVLFCFFSIWHEQGPRQWCRFYVKHNPDIYFLPHLSIITQTKDTTKIIHFSKFIACQDLVGCRDEHVTCVFLDSWALRSNIRFWCIVLHASLLLLILSFRWWML